MRSSSPSLEKWRSLGIMPLLITSTQSMNSSVPAYLPLTCLFTMMPFLSDLTKHQLVGNGASLRGSTITESLVAVSKRRTTASMSRSCLWSGRFGGWSSVTFARFSLFCTKKVMSTTIAVISVPALTMTICSLCICFS